MTPSSSQPTAPEGQTIRIASIHDLKIHCANCSMRELCLPVGLEPGGMDQLDALVTNRLRFKKGATVYRSGDPFSALYAIRLGSCKTTLLAEDGREQIAGYHMLGDVIGLDGIAGDRHGCEAVALEDTEVCVLPFGQLRNWRGRSSPCSTICTGSCRARSTGNRT